MVMGHNNWNDGQNVINKTNLKKAGHVTYYNVTLRRVRATIVAVGKL
jgi:hypothetical protein